MISDASLKKQVLIQLLYSEIFRHPLTGTELQKFIPAISGEQDRILEDLTQSGLISEHNGFYYVFDANNKVTDREKGMQRAEENLPKAFRIARFIYKFPFVKGVGISGSLSKGILHEDGDFDYFIITRQNRLWVARTLLVLYKKMFLLNSRKYFCVNYFVDDTSLEIQEKNLFTATEICTLIPVAGSVFHEFYKKNEWTRTFFPIEGTQPPLHEDQRKPLLSRGISTLFNGSLGEWIDIRCMRLTFRRWKKKFNEFNDNKFDLTLKTRRYVSKHHPNDFQTKVLTRHNELIGRYKHEFGNRLQEEGIVL